MHCYVCGVLTNLDHVQVSGKWNLFTCILRFWNAGHKLPDYNVLRASD